jgi:uncharacterized protein (UPF0333 family)
MKSINQKAQGSIEYLLIIGAAILVAVIVVVLLVSTSSTNRNVATQSEEQYSRFIDSTIMAPLISNVSCSTTDVNFVISPSSTAGVSSYYLVVDGVLQISPVCTGNNPYVCSKTLTAGTQYSVSLMAKKGDSYSAPTTPAKTCTP